MLMAALPKKNPSVTILMYHSVNDVSNDRIHTPIVSTTNFERQMKFFASHANVISLDEYIDCVRTGVQLLADSVIITFDDGYKDSFTNAYPILRKYGLPATFFLATAYIGTGKAKWEDRLSYLIKRSTVEAFSVELEALHGNKLFSIRQRKDKLIVIDRLVRLLDKITNSERQQVSDQIQLQLDVDPREFEKDDLMLSWEEVRKMSTAPGISFGAHGVTHCPISTLSEKETRKEVLNSKKQIEAEIDKEVRFFSFPYGELADSTTKSLLKSYGFDCAVTGVYGRNDLSSDLFQLKRVMPQNHTGLRFRIGLSIRSSKAGESLRRGYNLLRQGIS